MNSLAARFAAIGGANGDYRTPRGGGLFFNAFDDFFNQPLNSWVVFSGRAFVQTNKDLFLQTKMNG